MSKYLISISSTIKRDDDTSSVELTTVGNFRIVNRKCVLAYTELQEDGSGSIDTIISAEENCVRIIRKTDETSELLIQLHQKNLCRYNNDYGFIMIGVYCTDIDNRLNESGGILTMKYTLDVNSSVLSHNEVIIKVREVNSDVKNSK